MTTLAFTGTSLAVAPVPLRPERTQPEQTEPGQTEPGQIRPDQIQPVHRHPGLTLVQLNDELWRVTRPSGEVLGYLEQFRVRAGLRYRAKRFIVRQKRFIEVGEFWSIDEAIACFGF